MESTTDEVFIYSIMLLLYYSMVINDDRRYVFNITLVDLAPTSPAPPFGTFLSILCGFFPTKLELNFLGEVEMCPNMAYIDKMHDIIMQKSHSDARRNSLRLLASPGIRS